jgi:hypothetical protein
LKDEIIESIVKTEVQNIMKIAQAEVRKLHVAELGIVVKIFPHSGSDKNNYECDVRLRDRNLTLERVPVATQQVGLANIPHVDDLVIVTFIGGDINSPIIIGRLYNDKDRPPDFKEEEIIYKPPYSKSKELRRVYLELPGDSLKITLSEDGVDIKTDSNVVIHTSGKTTLESDGGISIKAGGNLSIEASGSLNIESHSSVKLKSAGTMTIEGAVVKIN